MFLLYFNTELGLDLYIKYVKIIFLNQRYSIVALMSSIL